MSRVATYRKIAGIYEIRSLSSGRKYYGESLDVTRRIGRHKTELKNGSHGNIFLQRWVDKHGLADLVFSLVAELPPDKAVLSQHEIAKIAANRTAEPAFGFNLNPGGLGGGYTGHVEFSLVHFPSGETRTGRNVAAVFGDLPSFKQLYSVIAGRPGRKSYAGWMLADEYALRVARQARKHETRNRQRRAPPRYVKRFSLLNTVTGETVTGEDVRKFSRERQLCYNSLLRLIRGERHRHKDWMRVQGT